MEKPRFLQMRTVEYIFMDPDHPGESRVRLIAIEPETRYEDWVVSMELDHPIDNNFDCIVDSQLAFINKCFEYVKNDVKNIKVDWYA